MTDRERYVKALIAGQHSVCVSIEHKYDLYGYPPELVCVGLEGAEKGHTAQHYVEDHIESLKQTHQ